MSYKISLRINMFLKYHYIKNILRQYDKIIKNCSICINTTPNNDKIRYLEIYLYDFMTIEDFFNICLDLNGVKYKPHYNIKMRDIKNNNVIYSLKPYRTYDKKDGRLKREYAKVLL